MSCMHGYAPAEGCEGIFSIDASHLTFGRELTGIAICDVLSLKVKTGIASRRLRPSLAVVDPDVEALVKGTAVQRRLLDNAPLEVKEPELTRLFRAAMVRS